MKIYKLKKPRRRHIPSRQPRLARALKWLREIPLGPAYIVPTRAWTQEERDKFIVRNHLVQIFHPEHDLDITRGILIREIPGFLKTGDDYKREQRLGGAHASHLGSCSHK
ncbi:unnamed protein product [marine sediment metagenome]|uniref:Uncharacterized protein n=1 Tax=marine sediment metagenome TaxID=412755 RepID=X1KK94_9ZZZZ